MTQRLLEQMTNGVTCGDCIDVMMWFLDHPEAGGLYNLGTGKAQTFNDVAVATINAARTTRGEERLELERPVRRHRAGSYNRPPGDQAERNASTTIGSNSVPAPFSMIAFASNGDIALR